MTFIFVPTGDGRAAEVARFIAKNDETRIQVHSIGETLPDDCVLILTEKGAQDFSRGQYRFLKKDGQNIAGRSIPPFAQNVRTIVGIRPDLKFGTLETALQAEGRTAKYAARFKSALLGLYYSLTNERYQQEKPSTDWRRRHLEQKRRHATFVPYSGAETAAAA